MRVLIIEDDLDVQQILTASLKAVCFAVDATALGNEGSYLARTNDYDLVILDYMLPGKNGLEICKDIRENGKTMPIILLSINGEVETKITFFEEGVDDYLTKPFSIEELLARIKAVLRRPPSIAPEIMTVGELIIDPSKQSVKCGKKDIYLTRKEFSLLAYMARHEGMVVSRGMIMEHVWNMEGDPFSNTIESHILNLRKKLSSGKHQFIQTVPGRGYKLQGSSY